MITQAQALQWMRVLIAVAVALQTLEHWQARESFGPRGIWRWSDLRRDFGGAPRALRWFLDLALGDRGFLVLLVLRLGAAGVLIAPVAHTLAFGASAFLLFSTVLIAIRWRGLFNGGSDTMTALVLAGLSFALGVGEGTALARLALIYVGVQAVLSYFVAGLVKLKVPEWRSGEALGQFLLRANYDVPEPFRDLARRSPRLLRAASLMLLFFECAFPLALVVPGALIPFLCVGLVFHMGCYWAFGLNRFVFAWLAAYPAVVYLGTLVSPG